MSSTCFLKSKRKQIRAQFQSDSSLFYCQTKSHEWHLTFSETLLLLPFNNSGAIHGKVPRTPPETRVFLLIFDRPKSPTWKEYMSLKHPQCKKSTMDELFPGMHKTIILPCKLAAKDLLSLRASCHISSQNAQYFLSVSIPFQRLHP